METKECCRCHNKKDITEFNRKLSNADGRERYCKECHRNANRKHYKANKQAYKDSARKFKGLLKEWYVELKSQYVCKVCGEDKPWRLAFHHRDESTKVGEVSQMVINNVSRKKILAEVDKCDVLCHNHHSDIHYANRGVV